MCGAGVRCYRDASAAAISYARARESKIVAPRAGSDAVALVNGEP